MRLGNHFKNLVENIIENPGKEIRQIELMSEEEKRQVLYGFNDTEADYPKEKTIHRLFEEQMEETPDNIEDTTELFPENTKEVAEQCNV